MILIDSIYKKDKNYTPQVFLEKYRHIVRKKRSHFVTEGIQIYSDDSDDSDDK